MEGLANYNLSMFSDLVKRSQNKRSLERNGPAQSGMLKFSVHTYRQGNFILAEICWNQQNHERAYQVVARGIAKRNAWDTYDQADGIRLAVRRALDSMKLD